MISRVVAAGSRRGFAVVVATALSALMGSAVAGLSPVGAGPAHAAAQPRASAIGAAATLNKSVRDPGSSGGFVYRHGVFAVLAGVAGAPYATHQTINDRRDTAGLYVDATAARGPDGTFPPDAIHALVSDRRGAATRFDVPGGVQTHATGLNNRGQVVGSYLDTGFTLKPDGTLPADTVHGFLRDRTGKITTLDLPFGYLHEVRDINDRGQIVGYYDNPSNYLRFGGGFLRQPNGRITRIDVPGAGPFTSPFSINNRGQIVGWYAEAGTTLNPDGTVPPYRLHGFLWDHGRVTRIDPPGSLLTEAFGINNRGQIVGYYDDTSGRPHGFLLDRGTYTTLDAPGQANTAAVDINNHRDVLIPEPEMLAFLPVATP
jgi:probable HAF family extracellular repeat protein